MGSIDVSSRVCPGCVAVALRGELDISDAARITRALVGAAASGARVIVDLAELAFIDCSCLHVVVSAGAQAREAGGDLLLAAPQPSVLRLLSLMEMTGLLPVFASVAEAVSGDGRALAPVGFAAARADGDVNPADHETAAAGPRYLAPSDVRGERRPT